jgi:formate dehydrogenase major subunit
MTDASRRDFFRIAAAAPGTALGGPVGLGAALGPAVARAQELRIKKAKTTPSVCPYCSVGCATLVHTGGIIASIVWAPRTPESRRVEVPARRGLLARR